MHSTTKHTGGLGFMIAASLMLVACAQGVGNNADDDQEVDAKRVDAPQAIDAPQVIDAPQPIDARGVDAPSTPIDAPLVPTDGPPTGPFCASNADCTIAGQCCFQLPPGSGVGACVDGSEPIPGFCFPD